MAENQAKTGASYESSPELAVAALLRMMARYPMVRCKPMGNSIAAHLELVACDRRLPAPIRRAARDVRAEWTAMVEMQEVIGRQQQQIR